MNNLYISVDEAGEFNFAPKGSRYLVLSALSAFDIEPCVTDLYAIKHRLIAEGHEVEYFHASEDRQVTRDAVFDILGACSHFRVDAMIADKPRVSLVLREPEVVYTRMFQPLVRQVLWEWRGHPIDGVTIFTDTIPLQRKREAILKGLKESIRREAGRMPFAIYSHQSRSHPYLQLVDYCGWAVYVKWERGELRPIQRVQHLVGSETIILGHGIKNAYYELAPRSPGAEKRAKNDPPA